MVQSLSPGIKAIYGYGMENRKPVRAKGEKKMFINPNI